MIQVDDKIIAYCVKCLKIMKKDGWVEDEMELPDIQKMSGMLCEDCRPAMQKKAA
jgi:hypothetical protein